MRNYIEQEKAYKLSVPCCFKMNHQPRITVRNRYDSSQNDCWTWTLKRGSDRTFESSFDAVTYTYGMDDLSVIVDLIATDHVKRHRANETLIIESNLGFTPYETKGKDLHKDIKHTLILFRAVKKIDHPPRIQSDYTE